MRPSFADKADFLGCQIAGSDNDAKHDVIHFERFLNNIVLLSSLSYLRLSTENLRTILVNNEISLKGPDSRETSDMAFSTTGLGLESGRAMNVCNGSESTQTV
ncbi:hypothetical protein CEXT_538691 [Caerostris extrusa]|uniref:Uncharacterized protein n=1 Tax=Caerostris extrusa TaxID=172846 RepID=A0AAV4Y3C2_CAEEX|nr:hypothetical protein CEXT_538691 [Caerostris extrusa]